MFPLLVHTPDAHTEPGLGQAKARSLHVWVSLMPSGDTLTGSECGSKARTQTQALGDVTQSPSEAVPAAWGLGDHQHSVCPLREGSLGQMQHKACGWPGQNCLIPH